MGDDASPPAAADSPTGVTHEMLTELVHENRGILAELRVAITFLLAQRTRKPVKQWLSGDEVMGLLGISRRTLQNYRNNGTLGYSSFGGKIYYRRYEAEGLLAQHYTRKNSNNIV